jgi:hypothetical protein
MTGNQERELTSAAPELLSPLIKHASEVVALLNNVTVPAGGTLLARY